MSKPTFNKVIIESGQALVLVLLSLSVVLTIVLFILSRSVTDISTSTGQADSVRAFSAAEAGIEKALITGSSATNITIGDATYSVDISNYSAGLATFNYPPTLLAGDSMTLWFVSHDDNGKIICGGSDLPCFTGNTVKVCWGNPGTAAGTDMTPAVEASIYYETTPGVASTVRIARAVFDPNASRTSSNSFGTSDGGTCQIDGVNYAFQKTITLSSLGVTSYNLTNGLLFARFRIFYNSDQGHLIGADVNFDGNSKLPSQGISIISTGSAGTEGGQSNRRVSVFQGWPEFPFSGMSIFSPYGITK